MGLISRCGAVCIAVALAAGLAACQTAAGNSTSEGSPASTASQPAAADSTSTPPSSDVPTGRPSGVVFAALQNGDWILTTIDPTSGEAQQIADFVPTDDSVHLDDDYAQFADGGPLADRALFSADLTRAVATETKEDGSTDVGWIDRDGTFTDVTTGAPKSAGFSSTTEDDTPAFGPDGAFYFARRVPDDSGWKTNPAIWRLEGTDPAAAVQVATLDDVNYYVNAPSRIMPLCAGCTAFRSPAGTDRGAFRATDFLGASEYLSTDPNGSMIYRSPLANEHDTSLTDWGTDGTPLIPQTNRTSWSPVASPDNSQVAFLSKTAQQDSTIAPELYVVPARGGTPRAITISGGDLNGTDPMLLGWF